MESDPFFAPMTSDDMPQPGTQQPQSNLNPQCFQFNPISQYFRSYFNPPFNQQQVIYQQSPQPISQYFRSYFNPPFNQQQVIYQQSPQPISQYFRSYFNPPFNQQQVIYQQSPQELQNQHLQIENQQLNLKLISQEKTIERLNGENSQLQKKLKELEKEKSVTLYEEQVIMIATKKILGKGAFGIVHLAFIEALGAVAVKRIPVTGSDTHTNKIISEIANECQMLQLLSHANITQVYGYTFWPGSAGIIMEYMVGGDLKTLLLDHKDKVKIIPPVVKLRFVSDIANGIAYMHNRFPTKRVTHGDLKVNNILLTSDLTCKISDFGGADYATCTGMASTSPSNFTNLFTKVYLAPEALKNPNIRFQKSMDVYSASLMFYMILTRNYPFEYTQEGIRNFLKNIKIGNRPSLSEVKHSTISTDNDIMFAIKSVIEQSWIHDPKCRQSMIKTRDYLNELLSEIDLGDMQYRVCDIVQNMRLKKPCKNQFQCWNPSEFY